METAHKIRQLGKDTILYGIGSASQKLIGFLLFPLYTHLLSVKDFGAQDLILTGVTFVSGFLVLGVDSGAARYYYDSDSPEYKKTILSTWLWFQVIISVPVCVLLFALADAISKLVFEDASFAPLFQLGIISLPFMLVSGLMLTTLRFRFDAKKFGLIATAGVLVQAVAAIVLVAVMGLGIQGVFIASLISSIIVTALSIAVTYKEFDFIFSFSCLKPMLAYGLPLVPASLSVWAFSYANRYFLVHYGTLVDIGLLAVATRLSSVVAFVLQAFQIAWGPFAYSLIKDEQLAKSSYAHTLSYLLLLSLGGTVLVSIFAREAILVLATPEYESSAILVPWLCYSAIAWAALHIVGMGYGIAKKSVHLTISTILAAIATIALNFLLIPYWGGMGAVLGTMIGNVLAAMYNYYVGQHYFYVHYEFRRIFTLLFVSTGTILLSVSLDYMIEPWNVQLLAFKAILCGGFLASLYIFKVITAEEISAVRTYVMTKWQWYMLKSASA